MGEDGAEDRPQPSEAATIRAPVHPTAKERNPFDPEAIRRRRASEEYPSDTMAWKERSRHRCDGPTNLAVRLHSYFRTQADNREAEESLERI